MRKINLPIKETSIVIQNALPYLSAKLDPFLQVHPTWQLVFYSAIGLFGIYMMLHQDELNEVIEFIERNPEKFREELVNSKEFEKGFLLFLEAYLKQRIEKKKAIMKNVLLGYVDANAKNEYELERLNDTLVRISIESLDLIVFLKEEIIPKLEEEINQELAKDHYQKSDRSLEWWHDTMITSKSIWEKLESYIYDNYNPNSLRVKSNYGQNPNEGWDQEKLHRAETAERQKRDEIHSLFNELVTLGILDLRITGGLIGSGAGKDYSLTVFGLKFLKLIE